MGVDRDTLELVAKSENLIVIVGAGASMEAGLPSGDAIKKQILSSQDHWLVERRLGDRLPTANFFEVLMAYRDGIEDAHFWRFLESALKFDETRRMQSVCYSYEILAHLLHHRKIKALISLNFDEILDKAIELESRGATQTISYPAIASRSEFGKALDDVNESNQLPMGYLLKPHGTISRRLTVRITEESIRKLDDEKTQLIRRYLQQADVLTIGWRLGDPDIAKILLNTQRPAGHPVLVVTPHAHDHRQLQDPRLREVNATSQAFLGALVEYIEKPPPRGTASSSRTQTIRGELGSLRHTIRSDLFAGTDPPFMPTLTRELALEIVMHALKARGVFQAAVTFDCPRIVCLAEALERYEHRTVASVLQDLYESTNEKPVFVKEFDKGGEFVYWLNTKMVDLENIAIQEISFRDKAEAALRAIAHNSFRSLMSALKVWPGKRNDTALSDDDFCGKLADAFYALTSSFDIEIVQKPRDYAAFIEPTQIHTTTEFMLKTIDVLRTLKDPRSSQLLISTATGEWLLHPTFAVELDELLSGRDIDFQIIVDDPAQYAESPYSFVALMRIAELKVKYPNAKLRLAMRKHHNLTAVADRDGAFQSALYFRRESKSPEISPVHLSATADLRMLSIIWGSLVRRAV